MRIGNYPVFRMPPPSFKVSHPGLLLDRYACYSVSDFSKFEQGGDHLGLLAEVRAAWDGGLDNTVKEEILSRWNFIPALHKCTHWEATTIWRLAAHLARASTVQNASLSLHPLFGFAYLPGEGLKGLARAWALTLGNQQENVIERVLGTTDHAGLVDFMDAWPKLWPKIDIDIVNNHHEIYYQGLGAAGDWEAPNPTYFMAVPPKTCFRFAVCGRDTVTADDDVKLACAWLKGGLRDLGAGAKTAAGYGYFEVPE